MNLRRARMFCLVAIIAAAGAGAGARAAGDPPPAADAAAGAAAMPAVPPPAAPVPAAQTPPAATDAAEPAAVVTPVAEPGAPPLPTAPPATQAERNLDERIQDVKGDVIQLNRDLLVLEEELLFPANTQVAVFVSVDVGTFFDLDSVQVKLDDKEVANYLYTPAEIAAFHRGGVQRVYLGNLRAGSHELVAFFTGKGPHDRDYRRGTTLKFDKTTDPKYIELQIKDSTGALQPEFAVKVWQ